MKIKYLKIFILSAFSVCLISSCKKNTEANNNLEPNTWLESKDKQDTIVFKDGLLFLNRPKELKSGHLLPKQGFGFYSFKESKDSIALRYAVSSSSFFNSYAFKRENNTLYIGDFYQKSDKLLVFKKLK